jgi:hypothetical protein
MQARSQRTKDERSAPRSRPSSRQTGETLMATKFLDYLPHCMLIASLIAFFTPSSRLLLATDDL